MYHILTRQVIGGKYLKWIAIFQEFDLKFVKSKAKKLLVFAELICNLPHTDDNTNPNDSLPDESLFLISTSNPWYGDILLYLQTQRFSLEFHVMNDVILETIRRATLSLATPCTIVELILSYNID
jgi:hypothetical protein